VAKQLSNHEIIIKHEAATARRAAVAAKLIAKKFARKKNLEVVNEIARVIVHAMALPGSVK
jgi:hypothetical protein